VNAIMTRDIRTIVIYGYGVMGRGVARTFADSGFQTVIRSSRARELTDIPQGASAVAALPAAAPDLVIELVPEDVAAKRAVYAEIEAAYPDSEVLIATGTSGLDLVELAAGLKRPERFLGVHYFMPADKALVVEVMAGPATPAAHVDLVAAALRRSGKEPVVLYKPIVGFLVNRLQHAILHEAYYLIEAGRRERGGYRSRRAPDACAAHVPERPDTAEGRERAPDPRRCAGVDRAQALSQLGSQSDAAGDGAQR
jgi:3-hydroxybutyryl-CoA dehydrogenase